MVASVGWERGGAGQGSDIFTEGLLVLYDFKAMHYSFRIFLEYCWNLKITASEGISNLMFGPNWCFENICHIHSAVSASCLARDQVDLGSVYLKFEKLGLGCVIIRIDTVFVRFSLLSPS